MGIIGYNHIAPSYNELHSQEQLNKLKLIKTHFSPDHNALLLDVGCGTGLSSLLFNCVKVGIDSSIEMLRQATDMLRVLGFAKNLPFKDKAFDYSICLTALHNFRDFRIALSEMKRVTKWKIIVSVMKRSSRHSAICNHLKKHYKPYLLLNDRVDDIFFI